MSNKVITLKDRFPYSDSRGIFIGEWEFGKGRYREDFIDPFGNKSFRMKFEQSELKDHNIIPIGGYQFCFGKLFNIGLDQETTLRVGDLNDEAPQMKIGVPRSNYKSFYYNAEINDGSGENVSMNGGINISAMNHIIGFMVGDGGAREDNMTAIAPDYKSRSLFHPIPFRMSNDGYAMKNGIYFGKSTAYASTGMEAITSSYVKMFDDPKPHIVHSWVTDNADELDIVDDTVFSSTSSTAIESYVEINISLDISDCRGYFTSTDTSPRVNEFGLITGWYNGAEDDLESIRLFSHFTRPSISLADGDSIEAIYRLYAR